MSKIRRNDPVSAFQGASPSRRPPASSVAAATAWNNRSNHLTAAGSNSCSPRRGRNTVSVRDGRDGKMPSFLGLRLRGAKSSRHIFLWFLLLAVASTARAPSDQTPPTLVSAASVGAGYVGVRFSEPVEIEAAEDTFSYKVNDGTGRVTKAALRPDGRSVLLALNGVISGTVLMQLLAAGSDQQIIFSNLAQEIQVAVDTVKRWIDLLRGIRTRNQEGSGAYTWPSSLTPGS